MAVLYSMSNEQALVLFAVVVLVAAAGLAVVLRLVDRGKPNNNKS